MKISCRNKIRNINAANDFQYGTTYYPVSLEQLIDTFDNTDDIWIKYALVLYGLNGLDIEHMYGSETIGDTLYICDTDGEDIEVDGNLVNPETALSDYTTDQLEAYIQDPTDDDIKRLISDYELNIPSLNEVAIEMLQDNIDIETIADTIPNKYKR